MSDPIDSLLTHAASCLADIDRRHAVNDAMIKAQQDWLESQNFQ